MEWFSRWQIEEARERAKAAQVAAREERREALIAAEKAALAEAKAQKASEILDRMVKENKAYQKAVAWKVEALFARYLDSINAVPANGVDVGPEWAVIWLVTRPRLQVGKAFVSVQAGEGWQEGEENLCLRDCEEVVVSLHDGDKTYLPKHFGASEEWDWDFDSSRHRAELTLDRVYDLFVDLEAAAG